MRDDDDDELNFAQIDESKTMKKNTLTFIKKTNVCSLCPKIDSLIDCFKS